MFVACLLSVFCFLSVVSWLFLSLVVIASVVVAVVVAAVISWFFVC